eukprot:COSAG01_NODE_4975_length_4578_cov_2.139094_2_plen_602_part_00
MLDVPAVYVPVYSLLIALTIASYFMIVHLFPPEDLIITQQHDERALNTSQVLHLHALGSVILCSGYVATFHSLRQQIRLRFEWIASIAQMLGADKQLERIQSREDAIQVIVDLWRETNQQVKVARAEMSRQLLSLSIQDLQHRAAQCGSSQAVSIDMRGSVQHQQLAELVATKTIMKPWEEALQTWLVVVRIQNNWRYKKWHADWADWQTRYREWKVVAAFRGMRGRGAQPKEPLAGDYYNARDHEFSEKTADLFRDMDKWDPSDSTAVVQLINRLENDQNMMPPFHLIGQPVRAPKELALARLRWSSCYWLDDSLHIHRMDNRCSNQRPALTLIGADSHKQLQRWRNAVAASTSLLFVSICGYIMCVFWPGGGWTHLIWLSLLLVVIGSALFFFAAWSLSLLLAVELARDALGDVEENCQSWHPIFGAPIKLDSWAPLIQRPVLNLVHTTLPALSAWETPVCWTCLSHLLFGVLSLPLASEMYKNPENDLTTRYVMLVLILVANVVPCGILWLTADVSSSVNDLLDNINQLRMLECEDESTLERSQRAANLIQYLDRLNNHKGPGFLLFGYVVLDLRLLKTIFATGGALLYQFIVSLDLL